jgi:hypothetical protein
MIEIHNRFERADLGYRNLGVSTCVSSYQNKVYSLFHAHLENPTFTKFSRFNASHLGLVFSHHHLHLSLSPFAILEQVLISLFGS